MTSQNLNIACFSKLSDDHSKGLVMREHFVLPEEGYQGRVTIDILSDYALLEIFHFYKDDPIHHPYFTWGWKMLTEVCRRWRHVVLGSPRRLKLRNVCTNTTPTSRLLDIWPSFPIVVFLPPLCPVVDKNGIENIIAALECRDRTSEIHIFDIRGPVLEKLVAILREPLPVLTHFALGSTDESVPVLPETFLGGFAPRLQSLLLRGIPFSSFPKFVSCFTQIVHLHLLEIPSSGYISPKVMATCLAALPNLKSLAIGFRSPPSRPFQSILPHFTRVALPALSSLSFFGISEYFEDFVAQIDTPQLNWLNVAFFMDLIFDIPRLRNFIGHTEGLKPLNQAVIEFSGWAIKIVLGSSTRFELEIRCERQDWQLSSTTQIFGQQLLLLSQVEQLVLCEFPWGSFEWKDDPDMDSSQWLELFRLFVAAQSLHVSERLVSPVARALQHLTGQMATEVFPVLQTLFLEGLQQSGPVHEAMETFANARPPSNRPVVIERWESRSQPWLTRDGRSTSRTKDHLPYCPWHTRSKTSTVMRHFYL